MTEVRFGVHCTQKQVFIIDVRLQCLTSQKHVAANGRTKTNEKVPQQKEWLDEKSPLQTDFHQVYFSNIQGVLASHLNASLSRLLSLIFSIQKWGLSVQPCLWQIRCS